MVKSQAALEFLTTYAWAFLVIIILIAALAYFGILSPSKFLPERCNFGSEISYINYAVAENGVQLKLRNNAGRTIVVDSVTVSNKKAQLSCASSLIGTQWGASEIKDVPIVCDFTGAGIVEGEKEKLNLDIKYHPAMGDSIFSKEVQGEVFAVAGGGTIAGGESVLLGTSCKDILDNGFSYGDGTYTIDPDGSGPTAPFQVYCDMTTDGGGWNLVFMCFPYGTSCYNTGTIGSSYPVLSDTNTKKFSDVIIKQLLNGGEKIARTQWWHVSKNSGSVWADGNLADTSFPTGSLWNLFEFPNSWSSTSSSNGQRFQRKMGTGGSWTGWITSGSTGGCSGPAGGWSNYYEQQCQQSWFAGCEGGSAIRHDCSNPQDRADKLIVWVR